MDTFRHLGDATDFLDQDDYGWSVIWCLCDHTASCSRGWSANKALLLWMLRQLSFELKMCMTKPDCLGILHYTLRPGPQMEEASDLLLNLWGVGILDEPLDDYQGDTLLHKYVVGSYNESIRTMLSRGSDPYRRAVQMDFAPHGETATSLAMYTSTAFTTWLEALVDNGYDIEQFTTQELMRNQAVHPGWEKKTLSKLFEYGCRLDECGTYSSDCRDCFDIIRGLEIQPYWRHILERIKLGLHPEMPDRIDAELLENGSLGPKGVTELAKSSSNRHMNARMAEPGEVSKLSSDQEVIWQEDSHRYPPTVSVQSDCMYNEDEIICTRCWLHYIRTGTRYERGRVFDKGDGEEPSLIEQSDSGDELSENEYSPYHVHF